jgi:hypothetical protein
MELGPFLILGGALLLGALLVVGGILIGLRSRRQGDQPPADDPLAPQTAGAQPAQSAGLSQPRREPPAWLADWQRKLPPDSILLNRDAANGEWVVEVQGQRYRRLSDIHDDNAAAKILGAIEGLKTFAGLASTAPPAPTESGPIPPASPAAAAPSPIESSPRGFRQATYPAPAGSIIAQIETILQRELEQHPDLSDRSIHMGARPDGSLLIEVDRNLYRSPDEIADARVREVVMLAVRTWEKSS